MAKAKRKNSSRKRKSTQTKKNTQAQSNLIRVCLLLCFIALSIIAMMQFGVVGSFLYRFVYFFFGALTFVLLFCFILFCFFQINTEKTFDCALQYKLGLLFLFYPFFYFYPLDNVKSIIQRLPKH